MTQPLFQYKPVGDPRGVIRVSPLPIKPGDIVDGKVVCWIGNHSGPQKR